MFIIKNWQGRIASCCTSRGEFRGALLASNFGKNLPNQPISSEFCFSRPLFSTNLPSAPPLTDHPGSAPDLNKATSWLLIKHLAFNFLSTSDMDAFKSAANSSGSELSICLLSYVLLDQITFAFRTVFHLLMAPSGPAQSTSSAEQVTTRFLQALRSFARAVMFAGCK